MKKCDIPRGRVIAPHDYGVGCLSLNNSSGVDNYRWAASTNTSLECSIKFRHCRVQLFQRKQELKSPTFIQAIAYTVSNFDDISGLLSVSGNAHTPRTSPECMSKGHVQAGSMRPEHVWSIVPCSDIVRT